MNCGGCQDHWSCSQSTSSIPQSLIQSTGTSLRTNRPKLLCELFPNVLRVRKRLENLPILNSSVQKINLRWAACDKKRISTSAGIFYFCSSNSNQQNRQIQESNHFDFCWTFSADISLLLYDCTNELNFFSDSASFRSLRSFFSDFGFVAFGWTGTESRTFFGAGASETWSTDSLDIRFRFFFGFLRSFSCFWRTFREIFGLLEAPKKFWGTS